MTKLVVLGLLLEQPMHGYGIQQRLNDGRYDLWADILPNSIYNALRKMERDGMVRIRGEEQTGRQIRTIYEITDAGREEFQVLLKSSLGRYVRKYPSDLYIGLGYLCKLPPEEVDQALDLYSRSLREEMALWERGQEKKAVGTPLAEPMTALFENGKAHLRADLEFVEYLRENSGSIRELLEGMRPQHG